MIIGLILGFVVIIVIQIPILLKSNNIKKTAFVSIFFMGTGFVISLLLLLDQAPPSPAILIEKIVMFFI